MDSICVQSPLTPLKVYEVFCLCLLTPLKVYEVFVFGLVSALMGHAVVILVEDVLPSAIASSGGKKIEGQYYAEDEYHKGIYPRLDLSAS